MATNRRRHPAMATVFEAILSGDDDEHLDAVASAVFDEIDRVERLLSRFIGMAALSGHAPGAPTTLSQKKKSSPRGEPLAAQFDRFQSHAARRLK